MTTLATKILIADPNPETSSILESYLQTYNYDLKFIQTATKINGLARRWQPQIILVSANFSNKSPQEICQSILTDPLTSHIPVFVLQNINNYQVRLDTLEMGVSDIFTKPLDLEELHWRIQSVVRLSSYADVVS